MPALPTWVARLPRSQAGLARALWWAVRGRTAVEPGDVPLPYVPPDRVMLWTITVLGLLETAVVHVLVSWPPLRWPLLVLGVYGTAAMIAFDCTLRQHPHVLRGGRLILRFGSFRSATVPLESLAAVRKHVHNEHRRTVELDDDGMALSYMGGTNVELRFHPAAAVEVDGRTRALTRVAFQGHDDRAAVPLIRARMAVRETPET
jgi:hypothetical protein